MMRRTIAALLLCIATNAQGQVLINGRDIALTGAATGISAAFTLIDSRVAHKFTDTAFHRRHPGLETAANRASLVTETALMITGGAVYGIARLSHDAGTADVAFHTTESVASAAMFIQVVRGILGRGRPYVIDEVGEKRDGDPYEFNFLKGFTSFNYRSYPSMHAMASFATASALVSEMRNRDTPHRRIIAPALFAAATMPSLARMYLDEHWTSDIAMGIFLGIYSGQKIVGFSHEHPDNRVDHEFLRPSIRATFRWDGAEMSFSALPF
ncbi:MAG: phosphoesterase PA-phosphatase related protein [Gemmatimonadetes bacterium]|nr:phosphoesterase PA-phosphatase related protein [Gemmatimonadota bacterium]